MRDTESLVSKTLFPTLISLIAAMSEVVALTYYYFERDADVRDAISKEISNEFADLRVQVKENRVRIEELDARLYALTSDIRSAAEINSGAESLLDRLEMISREIQLLQQGIER